MPSQSSSPLLAADLLKQGRLDEARAAYREILARDAGDIQSMLALSRIERRCGNEGAACNYLRAAVTLDAANLSLLTDLAGLLGALARPDEAIEVYQRILALDAGHVAAHFGLGWIARARQDDPAATAHFTVALASLRTAAAADSNNIRLQAQLATALRELDRLDEAAALYRSVLAADAHHGPAHQGLGWIACKRRDHDVALEHFKAAAEASPGDLAEQLNFAKQLVMMNRLAEAQAIYARVSASAPQNARIRATLGALARAWQDWDGALDQFGRAVEFDPGHTAARLALGHTLYDLSRWTEAEESFRAILEESPRHIEALLGLAETAKVQGETSAALSLFETVAALAPLDYRPKNAIRRLKSAQGSYDWKIEVEEAVAVARSPDAAPAAQIEAARTLVQYGLTEVATPVLSRLQAHSPAARQLLLALRQMVRMGLAQPTVSGEAYPDPAEYQLESLQGLLEKPVPGSDTLLLVFAGTNNRTWMTFTLLHRVLRKTGVSIVYVRDLRHDWYASGVVGLGEDFDSSVEGFRRLAGRYGVRRILTLGNCVGCLGALRFGLSLGAEGVLGLGPRLRPGDKLEPDHKLSLRAFRERRSSQHKNVRARYLAAETRPKVTLFFGEHCGADAADARAMTEVPGVIATAIPGSSDPDCLKDLLVLGVLEAVLQNFVADATIAASIHGRIAASAQRGFDA